MVQSLSRGDCYACIAANICAENGNGLQLLISGLFNFPIRNYAGCDAAGRDGYGGALVLNPEVGGEGHFPCDSGERPQWYPHF